MNDSLLEEYVSQISQPAGDLPINIILCGFCGITGGRTVTANKGTLGETTYRSICYDCFCKKEYTRIADACIKEVK